MKISTKIYDQIGIIRGYLLLVTSVIFLLSTFFNWSIQNLLVVLTVISIVYSFWFMATFPKLMTIIMLGFGHFIFFYQGLAWSYWGEALISNLPLVALFVSAPLFAYPLRNGGYVQYITRLSSAFLTTPFKIFSNMVVGTMVLSSFMNLGSVRTVFELFKENIRVDNIFYTKALAQGFTIAMLWSPYFAGVAIVLTILKLSIFPFLLWGVLLVVISTVISILLIHKEAQNISTFPDFSTIKNKLTSTIADDNSDGKVSRKGIEMIIVFIGMFLSIFLLDHFLDTTLVILISVVAFTYPVIWSICIKKTKAFILSLNDYRKNILPRIHNEAILFISAAFFAEMIKLTSVSDYLMSFFVFISHLHPILIILVTILTIVFPAILGIHQILTVSVLGASISVSSLGISVEAFALAMIVGWSISTVISPVTALNLTLGNLLLRNPYVIGFWSLKYVIVTVTILTIVIYLINLITI